MTFETPLVFVVDDDASVQGMVPPVIRSCGWQPRTAAHVFELLARPQVAAPCCLLVELDVLGSNCLELQRLVLEHKEMPVIVMSRDADVHTIVQVMKAGAFEFLAKPLAEEALRDAVRLAIERSRTALSRLAQVRHLQERYESLSRRQREVLHLLVSGRLNKQVGGELGISEITVKSHRGNVMRKMQAASFAELVSMALSLGHDRDAIQI
jgi:FixJ family two-component response regulator